MGIQQDLSECIEDVKDTLKDTVERVTELRIAQADVSSNIKWMRNAIYVLIAINSAGNVPDLKELVTNLASVEVPEQTVPVTMTPMGDPLNL